MNRTSAIAQDVYFNAVPLRANERIYGLWDFLAVQICFGIAAWFFLVGSLTGLTVPAREAVPIILFGNAFPLLLIAPMAAVFARYGVDQWVGSSAVLGHRFKDLWLIVYVTSSYGWIAYASYLFGLAAVEIIDIIWGGPDFLTEGQGGAIAFAFGATILGTAVAYLGPDTLKWFSRASAVLMLGVLVWLIWKVFDRFGFDTVVNAQPAEPFETKAWSRASAIEFNVGLGFSWAFWYGQWARLTKSERAAFHGSLWGWGILAATAGIFSAFVALAVGSFEPTTWISELGGTAVAVVTLLLFGVANVSSVSTLVYPLAISTRSRLPRLPWLAAVLLVSAPALLLENDVVFDRYGTYLALIALLTGTYSGLMIADYLLVARRERAWNLRELYRRRGQYWYWHGFNPAAVIATVVAALFYWWTLDPVSWTSGNGWFPYITAGIPSFVIAFVVYAALMRWWVLKNPAWSGTAAHVEGEPASTDLAGATAT